MKNIFIISILFLFLSCKKESVEPMPPIQANPVIRVLAIGLESQTDHDTTFMGITETHNGDEYTFESNSVNQTSSLVFYDLNGGGLSSGDTLKSISASCTINGNIYSLLTPVFTTIESTDEYLYINCHWCILPVDGSSVNGYIKFKYN